MHHFSKFISIMLLAFVVSCTTEPTATTNVPAPVPTGTDTINSITNSTPTSSPNSRPTCKLVGSVMEGNMFWAEPLGKLVVISAEEETKDANLGESHRILSVYDQQCKQLFRQVLPVNFSPDFPYFLSEITYNKVSNQIAIRGYDKFYIFNLENLKLTNALSPKFQNKRFVEDAQSGSIKRLELWENYLIGFAASMGPFVYDLSNPETPSAVMPQAEFPIVKGEQYNTMFLLRSTDGDKEYQALLPDYDYDKENFKLNILFEKPMKFQPVINKSFKDNRFILLKEQVEGGNPIPHAVDMKERKIIELPAELTGKKDGEILTWLKAQTK